MVEILVEEGFEENLSLRFIVKRYIEFIVVGNIMTRWPKIMHYIYMYVPFMILTFFYFFFSVLRINSSKFMISRSLQLIHVQL